MPLYFQDIVTELSLFFWSFENNFGLWLKHD